MDREAGRVPSCTIHEMKGNNAPLHHVPSILPVGQYNIDDDLLEAFFDPMAPIDFGSIDLDQITNFPQEISTSEGDFGVVPNEPIRDGMVPQLQHGTKTKNKSHPLPLPPPITTGLPRNPVEKNAFPDTPTYSQAVNNPITTGVSIKEEMEVPPSPPALRGGYRRERHPKTTTPKEKGPPHHRLKTTGRGQIFEDSRKREDILARWREKKARRNYNRPKVQYESRKRTALEKCRVNGKFVKPEIYKAYVEAQEKSAKQALHTVPVLPPAIPLE